MGYFLTFNYWITFLEMYCRTWFNYFFFVTDFHKLLVSFLFYKDIDFFYLSSKIIKICIWGVIGKSGSLWALNTGLYGCSPVLRTIWGFQCLVTFLPVILLVSSYTAKKACRLIPVMKTPDFQLPGQVETNTRAVVPPTSEPSLVLEDDNHNSHPIVWWVFLESFPFPLLRFVLFQEPRALFVIVGCSPCHPVFLSTLFFSS